MNTGFPGVYPPTFSSGLPNPNPSSGRSSTSTTYSDNDNIFSGSELYGKTDRGSPMSHLHSLQNPAHVQASHAAALKQFSSMTIMDDQLQAALGDQQYVGWGGRPIQKREPQQAPRMMQRHDSCPPNFSQQLHRMPSGGPNNNPQHRGGQQGPRGGQYNNQHNNNNGRNPRNDGRNNNNHRGNQHSGGNGLNNNNAANKQQGGHGYRRLWQQVTQVHRGERLGNPNASNGGEATVEDLLDIVCQLPPEASAAKAVARGLYFLDSGALAALLKELNKAGHSRRAQEIFDWLRTLDSSDDLYGLCNTMTYTTMISQCGSQQQLRRALELVAEMRSRGVQCNVHTYSALMNVCIKANELDLALDVYRQMLAEGCTPNLVTYNTLIDVYGKTGAWEEAIKVLDVLEKQGIDPEVRTYNTVIIACNQSSKAQEALAVYERMLAAGAQPTATTYTALISAYGKAGQLDRALGIFQDMVCCGCERNVITYSSLISACEKAGQWELALELFRQMHTEGCRPNVVTYNSLIAACAQGAQWGKAQELFELMQTKGCKPDSVTFGGLISAYDRAGQWRQALVAYEQMRAMNCRPDSVVFNTIIGALWRTGIVWAQTKAAQIFHHACRQGHFRLTVHSTIDGGGAATASTPTGHNEASTPRSSLGGGMLSPQGSIQDGGALAAAAAAAAADSSTCCSPAPSGTLSDACFDNAASLGSPLGSSSSPLLTLNMLGLSCGGDEASQCGESQSESPRDGMVIDFGMHAFTVGSAVLSLLRWVGELRDSLPAETSRELKRTVRLSLNKGKPSREHTYPSIKAALLAAMEAWKSPFTLTDTQQGCRIEANANDIAVWLRTPEADRALAVYNARAQESSPKTVHRDMYFQDDVMVESRCSEAFAAVRRFESTYKTTVPTSSEFAAQRSQWFQTAAAVCSALGLSQEILHDAILLLDRAIQATNDPFKHTALSPTSLIVGAIMVAAQQAGAPLPASQDIETVTVLSPPEVSAAEAGVRELLGGDTSAISALRVLKLYLERLGAELGRRDGMEATAGSATELLDMAVCAGVGRTDPPSMLAAAVLLAGRQRAGVSPFWPTALISMTGFTEEEEGSVLTSLSQELLTLAQTNSQQQQESS